MGVGKRKGARARGESLARKGALRSAGRVGRGRRWGCGGLGEVGSCTWGRGRSGRPPSVGATGDTFGRRGGFARSECFARGGTAAAGESAGPTAGEAGGQQGRPATGRGRRDKGLGGAGRTDGVTTYHPTAKRSPLLGKEGRSWLTRLVVFSGPIPDPRLLSPDSRSPTPGQRFWARAASFSSVSWSSASGWEPSTMPAPA